MRGRIVAADDRRLTVQLSAGEIPVPWAVLSARQFADIAAKYAGEAAEQRVQLAALYAAAGRPQKANQILAAVGALDEGPLKTLAAQILTLVRPRP